MCKFKIFIVVKIALKTRNSPLFPVHLSICLSSSLSLSYLLGRRRWRSPWPSWPEPWAAPAEWGRSSLPPPARSGTSGIETHTLRARTQERRRISFMFMVWRETFVGESATERKQRCQTGSKRKKWIRSDRGGGNEWKDLGQGSQGNMGNSKCFT